MVTRERFAVLYGSSIAGTLFLLLHLLVEACTKAGIKAEIIDPKEAIRLEPSVNPDIIGAVRVPDGSVDPFRLCSSNVVDAKLHGAEVLVYTEVTGFIFEGANIVGVKVHDKKTGNDAEYRAPITVNADASAMP